MWPFEDEIERWFDHINVKRRRKAGLPDVEEDDEDDAGYEMNTTPLAPIPVRR